MKKRFSRWLIVVAMTMPALGMASEFSQNTQYREEVLSVAPYRIKYVLTGQTHVQPSVFPAIGLDGDATFVYALAGKDVFVQADDLHIGSPNLYLWLFKPLVNVDPANPIGSITAPMGTGFALMFNRTNGLDYQLSGEFIVELKPGFTYQPDLVRMQAVYSAGLGAPYIDVFRREL
jgi:hypothetical protein